jgi:hypothetical protein
MWMGVGQTDSALAKHRAELARLDHQWRNRSSIPADLLGRLAWYSLSVDTAAASYWRSRLLRDAPSDGFALQWRLIDALTAMSKTRDTTAVFRTLDSLWDERSVDRAAQIAGAGLGLAVSSGRSGDMGRWVARVKSVSNDTIASEITFADQLSRVPAFASEGATRLRAVLSSLEARHRCGI